MGVYRLIAILIVVLSVSVDAFGMNIRVKVEEGKTIQVEPLSDSKIYNNDQQEIGEIKANQVASIKYYTSNKATLNGKKVSLPLRIVPTSSIFNSEPFVYIGNRKYRGTALIVADKGRLLGINVLDIEDYLKGVVSGEMPQEWNLEALKSQAIAARTYAYYGLLNPKNDLYDICDTVSCQVYKGVMSEYESTNIAVDATKSKVLTYNDRVIEAFFHDTSGGGMTESGEKFLGADVPYLQPVKDYDFDSPYRNWSRSISVSGLLNRVEPYGVNIEKLKKISVIYGTSGRVKSVVVSDGNRSYTISGEKFRQIMGLRSNSFTVAIRKNTVYIEGSGNGHGIGLSQWGALGMAKLGYKYNEILSHYYPGTLIVSYE